MNTQVCFAAFVIFFLAANAKQPIPFDPIHPGTLHADHFSPLTNDGINVPNFRMGQFSSLMLDFSSLDSATPVSFDLAGGAIFDTQNLNVETGGLIAIGSEVNSFSIEALGGEARFQGEDLEIFSYGGDMVFESLQNDVNLQTLRGDIFISASGFSAEGNFREGGINLDSEGALGFETGSDGSQNGNIDFQGESIFIVGDAGIIASSGTGIDSDMYFYALDKLDVDSDGAMNLGSTETLEIYSLSGPMNVEAANLNVQSPDFFLEATGSNSVASALARVEFTAGSSINARSSDQVKFTSNEDGVHGTAGSDISFTAGDVIDISSSLDDSTMNLSSDDLIYDSQLDQVQVHATDRFEMRVSSDMEVNVNNDAHITAQSLFEVKSSSTITHDISRNLIISAGNTISFDGQNGNLLFDIDDDLFVIGEQSTQVSGTGILFTIADDADFDAHGDVIFEIQDDITFNFNREGVLSGEIEMDMTSGGLTTIDADDIVIGSGDSVDFQSNDLTVSLNDGDIRIDSPKFATYRANTLEFNGSEDMLLFANGRVDMRAVNDLSITTNNNDISFASQLNTDIYLNEGSIISTESANLEFTRDLQMFIHEGLSFNVDDGSVDSIIEFESGDNFRMESGDFSALGNSMELSTELDLTVFARRQFNLISGGDFMMTADNEIVLVADTDLTISSDGLVHFTAGNDMRVSTTEQFHGDILLQSLTGDIDYSIDDSFSMDADRLEMEAGSSISISSDTIGIRHDDNNPTDHGNVVFASKDTLVLESLEQTISTTGRTVEYSGLTSVESVASEELFLSALSNDDIIVSAASDISIETAQTTSFNSGTVEFFGVESASVTADNIEVDSNDIRFDIDNDTTFTAENDLNFENSNELETLASESLLFQGAVITVNTDTFTIDENGDGTEFNAQSTVDIDMQNMFTNAGDLIEFFAETSRIDLDAVQNLESLGGEHHITSTGAYDLSSRNTGNLNSNDNGFVSFKSSGALRSSAGTRFSILGDSSLLTTTDGRFGTIKATAGEICFISSSVEKTSFTGDSTLFTASGPNAALDVTSKGPSSFTSNSGSIGISAFGVIPQDPQFLFEDDVTFGILFRTMESSLNEDFSVEASDADITAFSFERFFVSTNTSNLISEAGSINDFRTYGRDASINAITPEGDLFITFDTSTFTAGNPLLPADLRMNATRDVLMRSDGDGAWRHLGTSSVEDVLGILIQSSMEMTYNAAGDFEVNALAGGVYNLESRDGDVTFTSAQDAIEFFAETGSISMFSSGSTTFVSQDGAMEFSAQGDGGSVFLQSGGEQIFQMIATSEFFIEAEFGEIDFEGTTRFQATAGSDGKLEGNCINIEGGSVKYEALTNILFSSEEEIAFESALEFTVDASNIDFTANQQMTIDAGGDGVNPGISITAVGNIIHDTPTTGTGDITFNATNFLVDATGSILFDAQGDVLIRSTLDSLLRDSITATAQNGAGFFTSADYSSKASLTQTTTTETLTVTSPSINFASKRESRFETEGNWVTTTTSAGFSGGDIDADFAQDFTVTGNEGINFAADYSLEFIVGGDLSQTSATSFAYNILGDDGQFTIDSEQAFTITGTDWTSSVIGEMDIFSKQDIEIDSNAVLLNAFDDINLSADSATLFKSVSFASVSDSYILRTDSSFEATQTTASFASSLFEASSFRDMNLDTSAFSLTSGAGQPVNFLGEDVILTSDAVMNINSPTGTTSFTSIGDDTTGVEFDIDVDLTFSAANTFSFESKNDILFTSLAMTLNVANSFNFQTTGAGGIQLLADTTNSFTTTNLDINFETQFGNIETYADILSYTAGDFISFETGSKFGDISLRLDETNMIAAGSILLEQYVPTSASGITASSPQSGSGFIQFKSDAFILVAGTTLDLNSDDDITARGIGLVINPTGLLSVEGGNAVDFFGYSGIEDVTTGNLEFLVTDTSSFTSELRMLSNEISYNSPASIAFEATGELRMVSASTIEITAGTALNLVTNTNFDINMISERKDIIIEIAEATLNIAGDLAFTARGSEGALSIDTLAASIQTSNFYVEAEDSIIAPFSTFSAANSILVQSAKNVLFESNNRIDVLGSDVNFRATNNGPITTWVGGDLISNTGSDLTFRAEGMLGTIGGRYVLQDTYWLPYTNEDDHHRINRNTNGIEITNVAGDLNIRATDQLFITAHQGSVEFRTVNTLAYRVPNVGGTIYFFGITDAYVSPVVTLRPAGSLPTNPVAHSNNYCLGNGGCNARIRCANDNFQQCPTVGDCALNCTELSQILNEIIGALIAYGLLLCDGAGSAHCF